MQKKLIIRFRKSYFIPSMLSLLLLLSFFFAALTQLSDTDIWWHLAAGRHIFHERALLSHDVFSFTASGLPLGHSMWLFDLTAFLVSAVAGPGGLVIGKALLIASAFGLIFQRSLARGANRYVAIGIVFWAMLAGRPAFSTGPALFDYLFLAVLLLWLRDYSSSRSRAIYAAPLLLLAWAALGRAAWAGPAVLAIAVAGDAVTRLCRRFSAGREWRPLPPRALLSLLGLFILCAGVVWLSGVFYGSGLSGDGYFPSPGYDAALSPIKHPAYGLMLLAAAAALFVNITVMTPADSLMLLFWGLLSFRSAGNVPLFALCAAPILASQVSDAAALIPPAVLSLLRRARRWIDIALCIALAAFIVFCARRPDFGLSVRPMLLPEGAAGFIEKNRPEGKMFNDAAWGGYLAWRLYPSYRVFIDDLGRGKYPAVSWEAFSAVASGSADWRSVCDANGVNFLLLPPRLDFIPLLDSLSDDGDWRLAYWDLTSFVYVRDIPEHAELIKGYLYKSFEPENQRARYWVPPLHLQTVSEIKRYLKDFPRAVAPRSELAMQEFKAGRLARAAREYEALIEINPRLATVHHNLALIASALGDAQRAEREYLKEVEINPAFPPAWNNLGRIYLNRRELDRAEKMFRKALETDPDYIHARSNIGFIFMERGEFDSAAAEFETVLKAAPHDRAAFHNLRLARQLAIQKEPPAAPGERVYGPLTRDEAKRWYLAPAGEDR